MRIIIAVLFALFTLSVETLGAADTSGSLRLLLQDPSGAVIPDAKVVIVLWKSDNLHRQICTVQSLAMDSKGEYSTQLEPGEYDVLVSHDLMLPFVKRIRIEANKDTKLRPTLRLDPKVRLIP